MKLAEIADILVRSVSAFESKIGGKYSDLEAVEAMIPFLRQDAIILKYNGSQQYAASKRIDNACMSKPFKVSIVPADQDSALDYIVFSVPRFVNIAPKITGDIYVGAKDKTQPFKRVSSRGQIGVLKSRGYLNNGRDILYQPLDNEIHIYGNKMLKELWIEGILANPLDHPTFDPETEEYPISEEIFSVMVDLFKQKVNITLNQVQDNIDNDVATMSKGAIKQNNV